MRRQRFKPLLHLLIWLLVYLLPHFVAYGTGISLQKVLDKGGVVHGISTLLLVGYAYLNYSLLIPRFYLRRNYVLYGLLVIAAALLVIWFPNMFGSPGPDGPPAFKSGPPPLPVDRPDRDGPGREIWFGLGYNVILFIIVTLGGIGLRQQLQLLNVQREKLDAELSFLKAQVNPHFLFNTLNSIYALAIQKSDDTPTAIIQLSELMRYLLKEANSDFVPLSKELAYINNYVLLQKRRLGNTVRIDYDAPATAAGSSIAPLILMPFVENAFKHGVNPDEDSAITIAITVTGPALRLAVKNNKVNSVHRDETMGIGLDNTAARLNHLYTGRHELTIQESANTFSVVLTIDLT